MLWAFVTVLWDLGALFYIFNDYRELPLFAFRAVLLLVSGFIGCRVRGQEWMPEWLKKEKKLLSNTSLLPLPLPGTQIKSSVSCGFRLPSRCLCTAWVTLELHACFLSPLASH